MAIVEKLKRNNGLAQLYRLCKRLIIRYFYGLKKVHPTFNIGGRSKISRDLIAGEYSYIGNNCLIYPGVEIGRYTMLAQNVQIIGADHNYDLPGLPITFSGRPKLKRTNIGRDVWIGANSIVFTGITIGDGAIIAAGSIVTKSVESYTIVGGVPAKFIKNRFNDNKAIEKHKRMLNDQVLRNVRNKPLIIDDNQEKSDLHA